MWLLGAEATDSREGPGAEKSHPEGWGVGTGKKGPPWLGGPHYKTPEKVGGATGGPESKHISANGKVESMWLSEFSKE